MSLDKLVESHYDQLNEIDLYIWQYIYHHKRECQKISIHELAHACNVSHTSILRFTKKLGLDGFSELKVYIKWDLSQKSEFTPQIIDDACNGLSNTIEEMRHSDFTSIFDKLTQAEHVFVYGTGIVQNHMAKELKRNFLYSNKVLHIVGEGVEIDTVLNNVTKDDLFIIISLSGDNEDAVTLARALKGLQVPRIGIAKSNRCVLSQYCDEMITFKYDTFKLDTADLRYGSTAHFFIIADLLFLKYLEYLDEQK